MLVTAGDLQRLSKEGILHFPDLGVLIAAVFSIVLFEVLVLFRVGWDVTEILAHSLQSMRSLNSAEMSDDEKESLALRKSVEIFRATAGLFLKLALSICLLGSLFVLVTACLPELRKAMVESLVSPISLATLTVAIVCYARIRKAVLLHRRR
jgi:hypothetical protein